MGTVMGWGCWEQMPSLPLVPWAAKKREGKRAFLPPPLKALRVFRTLEKHLADKTSLIKARLSEEHILFRQCLARVPAAQCTGPHPPGAAGVLAQLCHPPGHSSWGCDSLRFPLPLVLQVERPEWTRAQGKTQGPLQT